MKEFILGIVNVLSVHQQKLIQHISYIHTRQELMFNRFHKKPCRVPIFLPNSTRPRLQGLQKSPFRSLLLDAINALVNKLLQRSHDQKILNEKSNSLPIGHRRLHMNAIRKHVQCLIKQNSVGKRDSVTPSNHLETPAMIIEFIVIGLRHVMVPDCC